MNEIVVFIQSDFGGFHTHIYGDVPDLSKLAIAGYGSGVQANTWTKVISSLYVVSGTWQFFSDVNYKTKIGEEITGPVLVSFVEEETVKIANDAIVSLRLKP